jgi:hypothetical protein
MYGSLDGHGGRVGHAIFLNEQTHQQQTYDGIQHKLFLIGQVLHEANVADFSGTATLGCPKGGIFLPQNRSEPMSLGRPPAFCWAL